MTGVFQDWRVRGLWSESQPPSFSQRYLEKDIVLYKAVISSFNARGETWNQTSWLRDRG